MSVGAPDQALAMHAFDLSSREVGGGRQISDFEARLVYRAFQDSQGYKEETCLKTPKQILKKGDNGT